MIHDFTKKCNNYDAKCYKKGCFAKTRCPACYAVGRFKLHGSYFRHIVYFSKLEIVHKHIEIKRVKCISCNVTHAVMPGDLIPYKLLSLLVLLLILVQHYVNKMPVLKVEEAYKFSYQFIYSAIAAFRMHASRIHQYFREASNGLVQAGLDDAGIVALIKKPYTEFQSGHMDWNKRPCFMCKFFNNANAPPTGKFSPLLPPRGQQHNI